MDETKPKKNQFCSKETLHLQPQKEKQCRKNYLFTGGYGKEGKLDPSLLRLCRLLGPKRKRKVENLSMAKDSRCLCGIEAEKKIFLRMNINDTGQKESDSLFETNTTIPSPVQRHY